MLVMYWLSTPGTGDVCVDPSEVRVTSKEQSFSPTRPTVPVAQFAVFVVMKVLMSAVLGLVPSRLTAGRRWYSSIENVDWWAPALSVSSPCFLLTSMTTKPSVATSTYWPRPD